MNKVFRTQNLAKFVRRFGTNKPETKSAEKLTPEEKEQKKKEDEILEKYQQKAVRVCVLGADTPTGVATSFMLKQNPLVSRIFLAGSNRVDGIAADLNHCDTRCIATGHVNDLPRAVRGADIILLLGREEIQLDCPLEDKLFNEGRRIIESATVCSYFAPRAVIVVCVDPISVTLPLVRAVYKAATWYHPGRIIGSIALSQIRADTLVSRYQSLDPSYVNVAFTGGPDVDCIVPLFTRATPVGLAPAEAEFMMKKFKGLLFDSNLDRALVQTKLIPSPLSEAYALNKLITSIGMGICGDDRALINAFVRSNVLSGCDHLSSTVKIGPNGVIHNYGLPRLYPFELKYLEKATLALQKRQNMADEFYKHYIETSEKKPDEKCEKVLSI